MIAVGKAITHGKEGIDYALNKKGAIVIDKRFIVGDNGTEIKQEFKIFQNLNSRAKYNDLSFVISPQPTDGKTLTDKQFKEIADSFLKKMELDTHQSIVVKHIDRSHHHLHIFSNRIDCNGLAYNDSFISKKSQKVADIIAIEYGLVRAKRIKEQKNEATKEIRSEIFSIHKSVLQNKPKNIREYIKLMALNNIQVNLTINKANKLQGFRVEYKGYNFKASEVHRSMSFSKMGINLNSTNSIEKLEPNSLDSSRNSILNYEFNLEAFLKDINPADDMESVPENFNKKRKRKKNNLLGL